MRPIDEVLEDYLADLEQESSSGDPWYGDPWYFDVTCAHCGNEYPNSMTCCPVCDHDEVTPVE